jgi:hypothetical protein
VTPAKRERAYRKVETDAEFRVRLATMKRVAWTMKHQDDQHGAELDDFAWEHFRAQRRIVEVFG